MGAQAAYEADQAAQAEYEAEANAAAAAEEHEAEMEHERNLIIQEIESEIQYHLNEIDKLQQRINKLSK